MPDLNSVPASPHALAASRQQPVQPLAQPMPPPVVPPSASPTSTSSAINILPSNQSAVNPGAGPSVAGPPNPAAAGAASSATTMSSPFQLPGAGPSEPAVGTGPGPLRHPRPLTATEMHMQLEKEQEAVVNRLTRELSLLRAAHNASVASNTSSTSAATSHEPVVDSSLLSGSGFTIPGHRPHHRTSSSASQNQLASSWEARPHPHHALAHTHGRPAQPAPMSRQDSTASRRSQAESPAPPSSSLDPSNYFQQQRIPSGTSVPSSSVVATPGGFSSFADQMSPGVIPTTSRYEETAFYRGELETAKRENETLKRKIRELERQVRERRASDASRASRARSDSVSTTASMSVGPVLGGASIAGPRDTAGGSGSHRPERERGMTTQSIASATGSVAVDASEDEVQVGESAASSRAQQQQPDEA